MEDRFSYENISKKLRWKRSHLKEIRNKAAGYVIDFAGLWLLIFIVIVSVIIPIDSNLLGFGIIFSVIVQVILSYNSYILSNHIDFVKTKIKVKGIKNSVKFLFLADIHYGPEYYGASNNKFQHIIDLVNQSDCDLVIIGGDFVCRKLDTKLISFLEKINKKNKLAIYGNHDSYYCDHTNPTEFIEMVEKGGFKMLNNEGFSYEQNNQKIFFGGIPDLYSKDFNFYKAFDGISQDQTKILLSHNPDIVEFVEENDQISLILSGHTHAGQILLPIIGPVLPIPCQNKWLIKGEYSIGDTKLFITQGLGFSNSRTRIGTRCEMHEIELLPQ